MVKVSIGVPVYNVEEYLRQCLNSIMEQTFTDFEVIMVDDGSSAGNRDLQLCAEAFIYYIYRSRRIDDIYDAFDV